MTTGGAALVGRTLVAAILVLAGCGANDTPRGETPRAQDTPVAAGGVTSGHSADALASLDPAVKRYVDAVADADRDLLVASFAPDAVIIDVGRQIRGHDAIRRWADNEVIGGRLTVLSNTPRTGGTRMLVRFEPGGSGGFEAYYDFDIADGLITKADLRYA